MKIEYSTKMKKESEEKKLYNIKAFSELDRSGLVFGQTERRLLMKTFPSGEKLYIQYPGKESARVINPRPWDFRPKLQLANGEWLKDLSFKDIWDDLYSLRDVGSRMSYIAALFFRIAYMLDSKKVTRSLPYEDIDVETGRIVGTGKIEFTWCEYDPDDDVLGESLRISAEALQGCSIPAYMSYNDYLAQNEDCKYYYRDVCSNNKKWKSDTGRRNTLLTHMAVIAFIEDNLKFTEITDMFQRGMGVAALPGKYWEEVTDGIVTRS